MRLVTGAISGLPSFSRPGSSSPLLPSSASARQPGSIEKRERGEGERGMVIMIHLLLRHTHTHLHAMPCHFDAYCKRGKNSEESVGTQRMR